MTLDEMMKRINQIQRFAYDEMMTESERMEFRMLTRQVKNMGYRLGKRTICKYPFRRIEWVAKNITERSCLAPLKQIDMSPNHKHLKGNCTTRAMAYIFRGVMTYDEIEAEQYRLADKINEDSYYHYHRNSTNVWIKVLEARKYCRLDINTPKITREMMSVILKGCHNSPFVSISSGHCAVNDVDCSVVDSWDSRKGKIKSIVVSNYDLENITNRLREKNIRFVCRG